MTRPSNIRSASARLPAPATTARPAVRGAASRSLSALAALLVCAAGLAYALEMRSGPVSPLPAVQVASVAVPAAAPAAPLAEAEVRPVAQVIRPVAPRPAAPAPVAQAPQAPQAPSPPAFIQPPSTEDQQEARDEVVEAMRNRVMDDMSAAISVLADEVGLSDEQVEVVVRLAAQEIDSVLALQLDAMEGGVPSEVQADMIYLFDATDAEASEVLNDDQLAAFRALRRA